MYYIVKNTTGNFVNGENIVRAFPNRFWLGLSNTAATPLIVPENLLAGLFFFDVPNGKKLKVSTLGPEVATVPVKEGTRVQIQYTQSQINQRIAFKAWLVENVYIPEMQKLELPIPNTGNLNLLTDDLLVDKLIQENFYYDL